MSYYDVGDAVRLTAQFVNADGDPADPTEVTLTLQHPSGTQVITGPNSDGVGSYYYDLILNEAGTWMYRWAGTGAVTTAEEGQLEVREPFSAAEPVTACEQLLEAARRQLFLQATGQAPIAVETPQLGRVVYQQTSIADLQRLVDQLELACNPGAAT